MGSLLHATTETRRDEKLSRARSDPQVDEVPESVARMCAVGEHQSPVEALCQERDAKCLNKELYSVLELK